MIYRNMTHKQVVRAVKTLRERMLESWWSQGQGYHNTPTYHWQTLVGGIRVSMIHKRMGGPYK